jgi:hypothetical protein
VDPARRYAADRLLVRRRRGKHDQVPEGNFYMKGGIEEVLQPQAV